MRKKDPDVTAFVVLVIVLLLVILSGFLSTFAHEQEYDPAHEEIQRTQNTVVSHDSAAQVPHRMASL